MTRKYFTLAMLAIRYIHLYLQSTPPMQCNAIQMLAIQPNMRCKNTKSSQNQTPRKKDQKKKKKKKKKKRNV